jgi:hypothetical protein
VANMPMRAGQFGKQLLLVQDCVYIPSFGPTRSVTFHIHTVALL